MFEFTNSTLVRNTAGETFPFMVRIEAENVQAAAVKRRSILASLGLETVRPLSGDEIPAKTTRYGYTVHAHVNGFEITSGEFCYDVRGNSKHLVCTGSLDQAMMMALEN